ncbi:MAG: four helix bundle protein [Anaerolineae bacterium]
MAVRNYRELIVWQKGMDLVTLIYQMTRTFPQEEKYGLVSQIRRSAVSIPSNIAEGQGRRSAIEFKRFLSIARGSLQETETQIMIAHRLKYIEKAQEQRVLAQCTEVAKLLNGLSNSLTTTN